MLYCTEPYRSVETSYKPLNHSFKRQIHSVKNKVNHSIWKAAVLLVGHCSAVALFGHFIKIEKNCEIVTILNSLKMYFLLRWFYTTVQQRFWMELIFGEKNSSSCDRPLECDLISQGCDKKNLSRSKKKTFLCDSERLPVVQQQTHSRPISLSKPIRDSEGWTPPLISCGPDIPVRVCKFENACAAAVRQRERWVVEMRAVLPT